MNALLGGRDEIALGQHHQRSLIVLGVLPSVTKVNTQISICGQWRFEAALHFYCCHASKPV